MRLAFVLFKYFPFGGLQRDFLRIALECQKRGAQIEVYCRSWQGEIPAGFKVHLIAVKAFTNHGKNAQFAAKFADLIAQNPPTKIIGFNKMPHLDWYYAADVCYAQELRKKSWFKRMCEFRRTKILLDQERAVFAFGKKTQILLLTNKQIPFFIEHYQTEQKRLHLLPPGIDKSRIRPNNYLQISTQIRSKLNLKNDDLIIMQLGSGFKVKGLNRSLIALSNLPPEIKKRTKLLIVGQDKSANFAKLAQKLNIAAQVLFLGGRDDVTDLLVSSDILLHPAYHEAAGMALLEALCAGLPVICTAVCGYSDYILAAKAGICIDEPFNQNILNEALRNLLFDQNLRHKYAANGFNFAQNNDLYSLIDKCTDLILAQ